MKNTSLLKLSKTIILFLLLVCSLLLCSCSLFAPGGKDTRAFTRGSSVKLSDETEKKAEKKKLKKPFFARKSKEEDETEEENTDTDADTDSVNSGVQSDELVVFADSKIQKALDDTIKNASSYNVRAVYDSPSSLKLRLDNGEACDIIILYMPQDMDIFSASGLVETGSIKNLSGQFIALVSPRPLPENILLLGDDAEFFKAPSTFDEAAGLLDSGTGIMAVSHNKAGLDTSDMYIPPRRASNLFFDSYGLTEKDLAQKGSLTYARNDGDINNWLLMGNINGAVTTEDIALESGYNITDVMYPGGEAPPRSCAAITTTSTNKIRAVAFMDYLGGDDGFHNANLGRSKSTGMVDTPRKNIEDFMVPKAKDEKVMDPSNLPKDDSDLPIPPRSKDDDDFVLLPENQFTDLEINRQYHQNIYYTAEGYIFVGDNPAERAISMCIISLNNTWCPPWAYQSVINRMYEANPYSLTCGLDKHAHGRAIMLSRYNLEQADYMNSQVRIAASTIASKITTPEMDDRSKAEAIYKWFSTNVKYDNALTENGFHAYGALEEGVACCQGYAKAMQIVADFAGLKACFVGGSNHAFCALYIDGEWYYADPTKNVPISTPRKYISDKRFSADSYWLRGNEPFKYN